MAKGHFKWENPTDTITYNSWRSMRSRCLFNGENSKHYKDKGITICDRWLDDYDAFIADMGERPGIEYTLDRIDGTLNYTPENCRWATHREQQNNKDSLTKIEYEGITHTIGEWANILDLDQTQLSRVYKRHSNYNCTNYEELFYEGSLLTKRVNDRTNKCKICKRTESTKWRKYGELCNTCYHRALRWSKRENKDIENYPEWEGIKWKTKHTHLKQ